MASSSATLTTFRDYTLRAWLPNHLMEASTRQGYTYSISRHLIPRFGDLPLTKIASHCVREWISDATVAGVGRANLKHLRQILSAIMGTAVLDELIDRNPCKGVKAPASPRPLLHVLTPVQYRLLRAALPSGPMMMLVDTAIATGLRWGELIELRAADFDSANRTLFVERTVVELNPAFHPDGRRFLVKPMPKSGHPRQLKIGNDLAAQLLDHVRSKSLDRRDLLFTHDKGSITSSSDAPHTGDLTAPNQRGKRYRHGTTSAYTAGCCRCNSCRQAAATYQRQRRERLGSRAGQRTAAEPGENHLSRDWFRYHIWVPALDETGLTGVRFHDLRHAHASWLLAGGASLQVVRERLGHASITTTERYLHTLPGEDESAIEAFQRIWDRRQ